MHSTHTHTFEHGGVKARKIIGLPNRTMKTKWIKALRIPNMW